MGGLPIKTSRNKPGYNRLHWYFIRGSGYYTIISGIPGKHETRKLFSQQGKLLQHTLWGRLYKATNKKYWNRNNFKP